MWHTGCDFYGEWADALADEIPDWDATLTPGTPEYDKFIAGMDKAAEALLELQEAVSPSSGGPSTNLTEDGSGGVRVAARTLSSSGS